MSQPTVSSKAETLYAAVNDYVGLTRAIIQRMEDRLKYLTSGIRTGSANEQELQNRISALEANLAAKERELAELRSNMESSTGTVQQANAELANLRRQLAAETAAKTTAETELANLKIEGTSVIAQKQAEIESLKTEGKARIDERDAEIQRLRTEGTAELELRRADINRLEAAIRDAEQNIVRLQSDIVARTAERDTVMRQLEEERARMATIMVQLDANNNEQQVRKGELQQLQQALAAAQAEVTRLTGELADTSVSLDKTKQLVDQQKTQLATQSTALAEAERGAVAKIQPSGRIKRTKPYQTISSRPPPPVSYNPPTAPPSVSPILPPSVPPPPFVGGQDIGQAGCASIRLPWVQVPVDGGYVDVLASECMSEQDIGCFVQQMTPGLFVDVLGHTIRSHVIKEPGTTTYLLAADQTDKKLYGIARTPQQFLEVVIDPETNSYEINPIDIENPSPLNRARLGKMLKNGMGQVVIVPSLDRFLNGTATQLEQLSTRADIVFFGSPQPVPELDGEGQKAYIRGGYRPCAAPAPMIAGFGEEEETGCVIL